MNNRPILNNNLRSAGEPYTIQLDNDDYCLTQEIINQNVDAKTRRRKDWQYVALQFLSLEKDTLCLAIASLKEKEKFVLTIKIEKDRLHISCSCSQPVGQLCRHAYAALSKVAYSRFDSGFFRKYQPGGPVALALKHKKHFRLQLNGYSPEVKQHPALGAIYRFSSTDMQDRLVNVLKLQGSAASTVPAKEETVLSYLLMYTHRHTLPFLIPAETLLNHAGNAVKGFVRFIQDIDDPIAAGQPAIFQKSTRLITLVKQLPGTINKAAEQDSTALEDFFQLWKELLPLVTHQPFVFKTRHWMWQMLKQKPQKMYSYPVKINVHIPEVQFELIDKGAYYQLRMNILINGAKLLKYELYGALIFYKDRVCLSGSLRDAAIIEFMQKTAGFITIFKEHFEEFEEQVLHKLSDAYFVKNYSENY
ncbi:hypothetical protein [Niabella beijingensis]|uniref:hypothetical protein n=1 Tax=Niabella beijingensis TaxID=2872700 RepID=UPI001CBABBC8|nr:hypothetical protein [Niabella beijingensis]MBZ4190549.1 hypothetical protein [Niabella beijingensis]